jgi:cytoskeletal protein RodZ
VELVDLSRVEVPAEWRLRFGDDASSLGVYLRQARLHSGIALDAISARTKIRRELFEDLERGDLSKWPEGAFYRESYLRAYALAVGLDAHDVVERYRTEFDHEDTKARSDHEDTKTRRHEAATKTRRHEDAEMEEPRAASRGIVPPAAVPVIVVATFVVAFSLGRWYGPERAAPQPALVDSAKTVAVENATASESEGSTAAAVAAVPEPDAAPTAGTEEAEGELIITSSPSGAHVTVDGIGRGPTPVHVRYLPLGSHTVRLVHDGQPVVTRRVTISPERHRARVAVTFDGARTTN